MSVALKPIFADRSDVAAMVSLSESRLEAMVRAGEFPAPRQISERRVAWLVREVEAWAEARPTSAILPPPNTGAKKPRKQVSA